MGGTTSKEIDLLSKEEVADLVYSFGEKFQPYASLIKQHGIDGKLLASLSEEKFLETLDGLEITARLHRRKFLNEFKGGSRRSSSLGSGSRGSTCASSVRSTSTDDSSYVSVYDEFNYRLAEQVKENEDLRRNVAKLNLSRSRPSAPPKERAAIVLTDVEGSTSLWEADAKAMHKAIELHDRTIRKLCGKYHGYEIDTEGDAFFLAFHEAFDALAFALRLQEALNKATWPQEILNLPWAQSDGHGRQGLRVRVSIHMGAVETRGNPVTGRLFYCGPAMDVARSLETRTVGGQILTTHETWNAAFHLGRTHLRSPQVLPLGEHIINDQHTTKGKVFKRILEVAPASLKMLANKDQTDLQDSRSDETLRGLYAKLAEANASWGTDNSLAGALRYKHSAFTS